MLPATWHSCLYPNQLRLVLDLATPKGCKAELIQLACLHTEVVYPPKKCHQQTICRLHDAMYIRGMQLLNLSGYSAIRSSLTRSFRGPSTITGRAYFTRTTTTHAQHKQKALSRGQTNQFSTNNSTNNQLQ